MPTSKKGAAVATNDHTFDETARPRAEARIARLREQLADAEERLKRLVADEEAKQAERRKELERELARLDKIPGKAE